MFQHILVPLDGSPLSEKAIPSAAGIAEKFGARLTLFRAAVLPEHLMVGPLPLSPRLYSDVQTSVSEGIRTYLDDLRAGLSTPVNVETAQREGEAAQQILHYAETEGVDLIVISTHGRSGFQRWLFGSVAERVLRHAPCPVLSIRPALTPEEARQAEEA